MVNIIAFLKTNTCCCGISLKTGTIAIVIVNLIFSLYLLGVDFTKAHFNGGTVFQHLIYLGVEIISLYGILKKKPYLLLAHLVLHVLFFVSLIITIIALIFAQSWIEEIITERSNQENKVTISSSYSERGVSITSNGSKSSGLDGMYFFLLAICVVLLLLEYHFFTVVFSYFLLLKIETGTGLPVA